MRKTILFTWMLIISTILSMGIFADTIFANTIEGRAIPEVSSKDIFSSGKSLPPPERKISLTKYYSSPDKIESFISYEEYYNDCWWRGDLFLKPSPSYDHSAELWKVAFSGSLQAKECFFTEGNPEGKRVVKKASGQEHKNSIQIKIPDIIYFQVEKELYTMVNMPMDYPCRKEIHGETWEGVVEYQGEFTFDNLRQKYIVTYEGFLQKVVKSKKESSLH